MNNDEKVVLANKLKEAYIKLLAEIVVSRSKERKNGSKE